MNSGILHKLKRRPLTMGLRIKFSTPLLLHVLLIYNMSNMNIIPSIEALKSKEINECQRCKILTKSVKHWLTETSRGYHEGGDTAWQEAKLKSYARSEMRLVEIQEGLCTELDMKHQDECYSMTEETDQLLDKWWFHENYNSLDLFTWLCIDTLLYCCPKNHYGPSCEPCPIDVDQKTCADNGKCDGEGTRKGNGTCICKQGYSGILCSECAKNFYINNMGKCDACHVSCEGCNGDGPDACHECKPGWQLESGACVDIDECADGSSCDSHQYCVNKDGSFSCKDCDKSCHTCVGMGPKNCTTCESKLVMLSGMCIEDQQLTFVMQRAATYILLILLTVFLFQRSKDMAYLLGTFVTLAIYYFELSSEISLLDIIQHIFS